MPVQEMVRRVSHFLRIDSLSSGLIVGESQGRVGHVALLVHARLMAMDINIAVKERRLDTYFPAQINLCRERGVRGEKRTVNLCL